jgi:hypothetical protein
MDEVGGQEGNKRRRLFEPSPHARTARLEQSGTTYDCPGYSSTADDPRSSPVPAPDPSTSPLPSHPQHRQRVADPDRRMDSTTMQGRKRRLFTQQEIASQLSQLHLFSSISSTSANSDLEIGRILLNDRQQEAYLKALKAYVADKEEEIEQVCVRNASVSTQSISSRRAPAHCVLLSPHTGVRWICISAAARAARHRLAQASRRRVERGCSEEWGESHGQGESLQLLQSAALEANGTIDLVCRKRHCWTRDGWARTSTRRLIRSKRVCESSTWRARSVGCSRMTSSTLHYE